MESVSRGRVLLVEADKRRLRFDARGLERAGLATRSTGRALDALRLATQESFDAIVCDVSMPQLDGLTLIRRLRENDVSASVVLLCEQHTNDLAIRAAEAGAVQLLERPVETQLFVRAVLSAIEATRHALTALRWIVRPTVTPRSVPATDAKNEFGSVLDSAVQDGAVVITKRDLPKAVLVSIERVAALLAKREPDLAALSTRFDELVARMRTPAGRAAARGLFTATPEEFGQAAVAAAAKKRD